MTPEGRRLLRLINLDGNPAEVLRDFLLANGGVISAGEEKRFEAMARFCEERVGLKKES